MLYIIVMKLVSCIFVFLLVPFFYWLMNVGAPSCGQNAAMRPFVRLALSNGYGVLGIHYGFEDFLNYNVCFII